MHRPKIEIRQTFAQRVTHSAIRALDVLAYFDELHRPATVGEIAQALQIPQSSTSLLLRTLVMAGYLEHDPHSRTFVTAERTALLGHWVHPGLVREGAVIEAMHDLQRQTGCTIFLSSRNGPHAQYVFVLQADTETHLHLVTGTVRPIVASSSGYVFMESWPDRDIISATVRHNAEHQAPAISTRAVIEAVEHVRKHGYSVTVALHTANGLAVATSLGRLGEGHRPLAIGIGGVGDASLERAADWGRRLLAVTSA
jgi:DNA-binding IclR family transcriptional regulator